MKHTVQYIEVISHTYQSFYLCVIFLLKFIFLKNLFFVGCWPFARAGCRPHGAGALLLPAVWQRRPRLQGGRILEGVCRHSSNSQFTCCHRRKVRFWQGSEKALNCFFVSQQSCVLLGLTSGFKYIRIIRSFVENYLYPDFFHPNTVLKYYPDLSE